MHKIGHNYDILSRGCLGPIVFELPMLSTQVEESEGMQWEAAAEVKQPKTGTALWNLIKGLPELVKWPFQLNWWWF